MLKELTDPRVIKKMSAKELSQLCGELRGEIMRVVSRRGGHLASNLGAVELTVALHYVFDLPEDRLVFDVGHQCYAHKLLTGRLESFRHLREKGGASGFPDPEESEYDSFAAGHASNAISAALGMARTRDVMHGENRVVAVVGDGALTGGMCYEALNDAGQSKTPMIVILNDNDMSISRNVGAMSNYLTRLRQSRTYRQFKYFVRRNMERGKVGKPVFHALEKLKDMIKGLFVDGKFFEALGFTYIGPVDGHDLKRLIRVLKREKDTTRPVLIHVVTRKGRGYVPAESNPDKYHGVAPFFVENGVSGQSDVTKCGSVAAAELAALAENDIRVCAITAAMSGGTGMEAFAEKFPERFFDVGIAEEHAVTMAAGMASSGMKPYAAIYSTFLQRAYDQILMDVCRPGLPVTFLIDRAGLVGPDGATHQGVFDLSYLRSMPGMVVASPRDVRDLKRLVRLSSELDGPMAIRYAREGEDMGPRMASMAELKLGEWELLSLGEDAMIFAVGRMVSVAMRAAIELNGKGVRAGVADARFVKPMDVDLLLSLARKTRLVVTLEENTLKGGFGEGVLDELPSRGLSIPTLCLGVPDKFIPHGTVEEQQEMCGLTHLQVSESIREKLEALK
jgi:1-deoxy-D-xylulose-5-phosphate synthase